jgi:nucleotide-binding universal stress UspA family protein
MGTHVASGDVVVGVDGSQASEMALRWAAEEATRLHRAMRLIHAFAWPAYAAAYGLPPAAWADNGPSKQAEAILNEAATLAHQLAPGVPIHGAVVQGGPAGVLTDASRHAAMVIMGKRGAGGFTELLTGSVSSQVARHGIGAIVVVPLEGDPPDGVHPRIVVGADGSPGAEPALHFAFGEAITRGATLTMVRAWHPPARDSDLSGERRAELEAAEARRFQESSQPWQDRYPDVVVEHQLVADHPARALTAAAHEALLLVVGARGREGFGGLHLGSVGMQVLDHAPCPVAVIRPPHHERDSG